MASAASSPIELFPTIEPSYILPVYLRTPRPASTTCGLLRSTQTEGISTCLVGQAGSRFQGRTRDRRRWTAHPPECSLSKGDRYVVPLQHHRHHRGCQHVCNCLRSRAVLSRRERHASNSHPTAHFN